MSLLQCLCSPPPAPRYIVCPAFNPVAQILLKAQRETPLHSLARLTTVTMQGRVFRGIPPRVRPLSAAEAAPVLHALKPYAATMAPDRRHLFSRFRSIAAAFKVVGTGSIGMHDYCVYLQGNGPDDPLFLQLKQESVSALSPYLPPAPDAPRNQGERVLLGQRAMQSQSDPLLGFTRIAGCDYLVRQLNDHKAGVDIATLSPSELSAYAELCGEILARSHARAGDARIIAGYIGKGTRFREAVLTFARAYAAQTLVDWEAVRGNALAGREDSHIARERAERCLYDDCRGYPTPWLRSRSAPPTRTQQAPRAHVPWTIWAGVLAVTSSMVGGSWDVAWHRSIGRDSFLTPAHVAIYACGVIAAVICGYLILRTTFGASASLKRESVFVLGFRAPLGAFIAAWGGIAMLTSAPFDNWWHNAYGLDVKIVSPPHTLLILGIRGVSIGVQFLILAALNRSAHFAEGTAEAATPSHAAPAISLPRRSHDRRPDVLPAGVHLGYRAAHHRRLHRHGYRPACGVCAHLTRLRLPLGRNHGSRPSIPCT